MLVTSLGEGTHWAVTVEACGACGESRCARTERDDVGCVMEAHSHSLWLSDGARTIDADSEFRRFSGLSVLSSRGLGE